MRAGWHTSGLDGREARHEGGLRGVNGTRRAESPLFKPTLTVRPDNYLGLLLRKVVSGGLRYSPVGTGFLEVWPCLIWMPGPPGWITWRYV